MSIEWDNGDCTIQIAGGELFFIPTKTLENLNGLKGVKQVPDKAQYKRMLFASRQFT